MIQKDTRMLDTPQKSKLTTKAMAVVTALLVPGGLPLLIGYYIRARLRPEDPSV